jgi:hypothetical protein
VSIKVASDGTTLVNKRTASTPPDLAASSLGQFRRLPLVHAFAETFFRSPQPVNLRSARPSIKGQPCPFLLFYFNFPSFSSIIPSTLSSRFLPCIPWVDSNFPPHRRMLRWFDPCLCISIGCQLIASCFVAPVSPSGVLLWGSTRYCFLGLAPFRTFPTFAPREAQLSFSVLKSLVFFWPRSIMVSYSSSS